MRLKDLHPKVRTLIHLRERVFTSHWKEQLGKHPEREFDKKWMEARAKDHAQAKEDFDAYVFWNFPLPDGEVVVLDRRCAYTKCDAPLTGKASKRYCDDMCRVRAWDLAHPEKKRARDAKGQTAKRQRRKQLKLVQPKSA